MSADWLRLRDLSTSSTLARSLRAEVSNFTCEIIGDGPLRGDLEARIRKLNLSGRVHLLGSLSQGAVLEKLWAADIFALPSVTDTQGASDVFPTVIIEAMAAARPVVSTRLAGIPESVVHGETGLLVPPEDTMALAEALGTTYTRRQIAIALWSRRARANRTTFPNRANCDAAYRASAENPGRVTRKSTRPGRGNNRTSESGQSDRISDRSVAG